MSKAGIEVLSTAAVADQDSENNYRLFEDSKLTRAEVVSRFLTPREGREHLKPTKERLVTVGSLEQCFINPTSSFIGPQIRDFYDGDRIARLGTNIVTSANGQLQNCGFGFHDEESLESYIRDMNRYFGSDVKTTDVPFHEKLGGYIITIFGHNRQLAIGYGNIGVSGHPSVGTLVMGRVFRNPTFWQAIEAQAVENTGESPPPWDRAHSIVMYKTMRAQDGVPVSQFEIAEKFNVHIDQIWRAERYYNLPEAIKSLVEGGSLPYSGAFELDVLLKSYGEDYVVDLAQSLASRGVSSKQIIDAVKTREAALKLTPEARILVESGQIRKSEAAALAEVSEIFSADTINEILRWMSVTAPTLPELKKRIHVLLKERLMGNVSMFDATHTSAHDTAAKDQHEILRREEMRAGVQTALTQVTRHLTGLRGAIEVGLLDGVVGEGWLASLMPDHLIEILRDNTDLGDGDITIPELKAILEKNGVLGDTVDQICSTLEILTSETLEMQQRRREQIAQMAGTSATAQERLF